MHTKLKSRQQPLRLIAELAMSGLDHASLSPEEGADFYDGLSTLLQPPTADAARYAATCLRECQRAREEILAGLRAPERSHPA
jgi:uncharacterized protein (DUF2336 family)